MTENWRKIPNFDLYSVSDAGRVRNDETGRILVIVRNNFGLCMVGLFDGNRQKKRSLPLLVANAFVSKHAAAHQEKFDTVIHLDGDKTNCQSSNLDWRPYWFAVKYHQQFEHPRVKTVPIIEPKTGDTYESPWEAATQLGLLEREIVTAILNRTYVWPTYQEFRFLE